MSAPAGFGPDTIYLHPDDCPRTLQLLCEVAHGRDIEYGVAWRNDGAYVDWDVLACSYLSTTERAVAQIARGCAVLERHGGGAARLQTILTTTIAAVTSPAPCDGDRDDLTLTKDVGRVLRDIRLLVTDGIGDEAEIMSRKLDVLARIDAVNETERVRVAGHIADARDAIAKAGR